MRPLTVVPISSTDANEFVRREHRHNRPVDLGAILNVAVADSTTGTIRGVAIVGRPVARMLCDGWTLEVLRTCTDGAANANSMLYGAAWRAARALGYQRLITYTQHTETGASLRAAGFHQAATLKATPGWSRSARPRDNTTYQSTDRWRWEIATKTRPAIKPTMPEDNTTTEPDLLGELLG